MIENNPISSLSAKRADELQPSEKKTRSIEQPSIEKDHDKVELSDKARMLSRANAALNETSGVENERVRQITQQIQDGTYQVPTAKLASILAERLFSVK